ncbi:hypothetical protein GFB56_34175 [Ensifer sp. T173]|uniref:Uncharacterized protein n=1 Tax=Ensifer canadensis TaxID=555315 RepID=A0AAW4FWT2_9HYPH|nr:hypothetical protein [Ensifer canadensis]MBM3095754.1 hypothetical protein [Ensifer canadensis]UBI79420.1 hypothetical protein J3R84_28545 [Ensifer canadensis]
MNFDVKLKRKKGPTEKPRPIKCEGQKTSRGEQLLRRNWEEAAKCISCVHYDAFFTGGNLVFVQCSYAGNALPRQALGNIIYRYDICGGQVELSAVVQSWNVTLDTSSAI